MHNVMLHLKRGRSRKTTTILDVNVAGRYVRFYTVRTGIARNGPSRCSPEGPLGRVEGYGLLIETHDGITTYTHESAFHAEVLEIWNRASVDPKKVEAES